MTADVRDENAVQEHPTGSGRVVTASLAVAISGVLPVYLTGALAIQMREEFTLTPVALGMVTTAFFLASSANSFLVGRRIDQWGWQRSMAIASGLQVVVLVGIAGVVRSTTTLLLFLIVGGMTHAIAMPAGNLAIVRNVDPRRRAVVFGIRQSSIPGAVLFAGLSVPVIGLTIGWRWAFVFVLLGPLLTILTLTTAHGGRAGWDARSATRERGPRIMSAGLVTIVLAAMLGATVVNSSGAFFVSSAVDRGTSEATAGTLLAVGSSLAIVVRVAIGLAVDRRSSTGFVPMATLLVGGAIGCALLAFGTPTALLVGTLLTFGAGTGWAGLLHFILVSQHPNNPAAASAAALAFGYAGGATGPVIFGLLADKVGYAASWTAMAAAALASATLALVSQRLFARRGHAIGV